MLLNIFYICPTLSFSFQFVWSPHCSLSSVSLWSSHRMLYSVSCHQGYRKEAEHGLVWCTISSNSLHLDCLLYTFFAQQKPYSGSSFLPSFWPTPSLTQWLNLSPPPLATWHVFLFSVLYRIYAGLNLHSTSAQGAVMLASHKKDSVHWWSLSFIISFSSFPLKDSTACSCLDGGQTFWYCVV